MAAIPAVKMLRSKMDCLTRHSRADTQHTAIGYDGWRSETVSAKEWMVNASKVAPTAEMNIAV